MRPKRWLEAALAVLASGAAFLPLRAQEAGRTVLARGVFSYEAPLGWMVSDLNTGYPTAQGPMRNGFAPNIHVDIVTSALPLSQFVADNLQAARGTPAFRLVSETPFSTAAGLDGTRLVVTDSVNGLSLRHLFYFLDGGGNQKIVVSACCRAQDGEADAALFDASLKTFSLE